MIKKVGFFVPHLGPSQQSFFLLDNLYRLPSRDFCPFIFYEDISNPCIEPMCAIMPIMEAFTFDGIIISTNCSTAQKSLKCPRATQRYFYSWDMEFLPNQGLAANKNYLYYADTYKNPKLEIITRNKDHEELVQYTFERDSYANIDNFDMRDLWNAINTG